MRVLSGIQPSGALHIGNYMGAIRQYIDLQRGNDAFYFVADYHALTSVRDANKLRGYVFDVIVDLLALGLDPEVATLFVQSDVPETTELAWLLTSVTPMGWLEKCVSYKDKVQQGLPAEHGLFAYPVLQAADILLYDAGRRPRRPGPEAAPGDHPGHRRAVQPRLRRDLQAPEAGTSSTPSRWSPASTAGRCPRATTTPSKSSTTPRRSSRSARRSSPTARPSRLPRTPNATTCSSSSSSSPRADQTAEVEGRYRSGGIGYGEVKTRLAEHITARFAEPRERRAELVANPSKVLEIRQAAAERARTAARVVLDRARAACGVG